jgi:site-specific DNA recombinase
VLRGLTQHLSANGASDDACSLGDRELIARYVERITVKPSMIDVLLKEHNKPAPMEQPEGDRASDSDGDEISPLVLTLPWSAPASSAAKGILHEPSSPLPISPDTREAMLSAIGKARRWLDDLVNGRAVSFAEIAMREGRVERHVRFLAPLAFLSPRIIRAIIDGSAPSGLTVTGLVKTLPYSWAEQERRLGPPLG